MQTRPFEAGARFGADGDRCDQHRQISPGLRVGDTLRAGHPWSGVHDERHLRDAVACGDLHAVRGRLTHHQPACAELGERIVWERFQRWHCAHLLCCSGCDIRSYYMNIF